MLNTISAISGSGAGLHIEGLPLCMLETISTISGSGAGLHIEGLPLCTDAQRTCMLKTISGSGAGLHVEGLPLCADDLCVTLHTHRHLELEALRVDRDEGRIGRHRDGVEGAPGELADVRGGVRGVRGRPNASDVDAVHPR